MEIRSEDLASVVHFVERSRLSWDHWPSNGLLFVIDLILGICRITNIDSMEAIIIIACDEGVGVFGSAYAKFIKDRIVFEDIT